FGRKGPADAKKTDVNDEISRLPQKNHTIVGTFRKMPVSQRAPYRFLLEATRWLRKPASMVKYTQGEVDNGK
ncbi:MAG: hypothetical protein PHP45_01735, partial [Elusimicrobiales bacterium]|nr:hypothetical protein [Elusimicrobiales bacterium]